VHNTKIELDQEKFFSYFAEGVCDVFEDTYVKDVLEDGL
jgi:hypothetical protein